MKGLLAQRDAEGFTRLRKVASLGKYIPQPEHFLGARVGPELRRAQVKLRGFVERSPRAQHVGKRPQRGLESLLRRLAGDARAEYGLGFAGAPLITHQQCKIAFGARVTRTARQRTAIRVLGFRQPPGRAQCRSQVVPSIGVARIEFRSTPKTVHRAWHVAGAEEQRSEEAMRLHHAGVALERIPDLRHRAGLVATLVEAHRESVMRERVIGCHAHGSARMRNRARRIAAAPAAFDQDQAHRDGVVRVEGRREQCVACAARAVDVPGDVKITGGLDAVQRAHGAVFTRRRDISAATGVAATRRKNASSAWMGAASSNNEAP